MLSSSGRLETSNCVHTDKNKRKSKVVICFLFRFSSLCEKLANNRQSSSQTPLAMSMEFITMSKTIRSVKSNGFGK